MLRPITLPNLSRRELMVAFAAMGLLQSVPPALAAAGLPPTTLARLFPELSNLQDAKAITVAYQWFGLSKLSPIHAFYALELRKDQFEAEAKFKAASANATRRVAIPRDATRSFLAAARDVEMTEGEYTPWTGHTDDYPDLGVYVQTDHGELHIWTRSQAHQSTSGSSSSPDQTPWAIAYQGRTFVVTSHALDDALTPIDPYLWPDKVYEQLSDEVRANVR